MENLKEENLKEENLKEENLKEENLKEENLEEENLKEENLKEKLAGEGVFSFRFGLVYAFLNMYRKKYLSENPQASPLDIKGELGILFAPLSSVKGVLVSLPGYRIGIIDSDSFFDDNVISRLWPDKDVGNVMALVLQIWRENREECDRIAEFDAIVAKARRYRELGLGHLLSEWREAERVRKPGLFTKAEEDRLAKPPWEEELRMLLRCVVVNPELRKIKGGFSPESLKEAVTGLWPDVPMSEVTEKIDSLCCKEKEILELAELILYGNIAERVKELLRKERIMRCLLVNPQITDAEMKENIIRNPPSFGLDEEVAFVFSRIAIDEETGHFYLLVAPEGVNHLMHLVSLDKAPGFMELLWPDASSYELEQAVDKFVMTNGEFYANLGQILIEIKSLNIWTESRLNKIATLRGARLGSGCKGDTDIIKIIKKDLEIAMECRRKVQDGLEASAKSLREVTLSSSGRVSYEAHNCGFFCEMMTRIGVLVGLTGPECLAFTLMEVMKRNMGERLVLESLVSLYEMLEADRESMLILERYENNNIPKAGLAGLREIREIRQDLLLWTVNWERGR